MPFLPFRLLEKSPATHTLRPMPQIVSPPEIAQKIREMLRRDLKLGNTISLADDMALVGSTMDLDSLDILLLVTNIEKEFGIKIASQDVGKQAFSTVGALIAFVQTRCAASAAASPAAPSAPAGSADYLALLPHRDPFRFLSRVVKIEPGVAGEAVWSLSGSEAFFAGHFPGSPLVPGVLIAEALAQLSGIVGVAEKEATRGKLAQVDVRFEASVVPPAEIVLQSKLVRTVGNLKQFEVLATCSGTPAARGTLAIAYDLPQ